MQDSLLPESYPLDSLAESDDGHELEPQAGVGLGLFARRFCGLLLMAALLCAGMMALWSGFHGWSAYRHGTDLMALVQGDDLYGRDLAQVQTLLDGSAASLDGLGGTMWFWSPILTRLGWVPEYGPTLVAAPEFVEAGGQLAHVAADMLPVVQPLFESEELLTASFSDLSTAELATLFSEHGSEFELMADRAEAADAALAGLDAWTLHPKLVDPVGLGQTMLPIVAPGLRSLPHVDGLLGLDGPQTYLVLVQNNDELRATGGFITALGRLVLKDGALEALKFSDSYWVRRDDVEYPGAPKPMQQYMGIQLLLLRDANWSPDLPTTARTIKAIYRQDTGIDVDGIVTVDMRALALITQVLSPLTIAGIDEPLDGDTVIAQIKRFWDEPIESGDTIESVGLGEWWMQRKDFMPALADAVLARAMSGDVDRLALVQTVVRALDERAVQVWIDEPTVAAEVSSLGWNGALAASRESDYIGLVDSNLGYNKVDTVLDRSIAYEVDWSESGGMATLAVTYDHPVKVADHSCDITPRYGSSYDDMAARCYFDYVRLYVPAGSELIELDGVLADSVSSKRAEGGTQVFGGYFVLPPGERQVVTFTYRLPERIRPLIDGAGYDVVVQRQSGTKPLSILLDVDGRELSAVVRDGVERLRVR